MKIVSMCTDRVGPLVENMLASLKRLGMPIDVHDMQVYGDAYGTELFEQMMMQKIRLVRTELLKGETVLWTDIDIVFRRDPREDLECKLDGHDIVFQRDRPGAAHNVCAGFFVAAPTPATLDLLDPARLPKYRKRRKYCDDQMRIQRRLSKEPDCVDMVLLDPLMYPSGWYQLNTQLSENRYMCHYNWNVEQDKKIQRMKDEHDWLI
jgi:hypothetical protein